MDVVIGFLMGAFTVWAAMKMLSWEEKDNGKIESEDITENGVDKD